MISAAVAAWALHRTRLVLSIRTHFLFPSIRFDPFTWRGSSSYQTSWLSFYKRDSIAVDGTTMSQRSPYFMCASVFILGVTLGA
jgi:hypothetical protein